MLTLSLSHSPTSQRVAGLIESGSDPLSNACLAVLRALASRPHTLHELEQDYLLSGQPPELLYYALSVLARRLLVQTNAVSGREVQATLRGVMPLLLPYRQRNHLRLSRLVVLHSTLGEAIVETPFGPGVLTVRSESALLVFFRAAANVCDGDAQICQTTSEETTADVLLLLDSIGALCSSAGEQDSVAQWEFHDALMHARTRGRSAVARGGTYRFLGKRPPEPAVPKRTFGKLISFHQESHPQLLRDIRRVLDERRSIRTYDEDPITAGELNTFLSTVARNIAVEPVDTEGGCYYETIRRPYPGGGACHELEIYPVVDRCTGLARGIYWYDPTGDGLRLVSDMTDAGERILARGSESIGIQDLRPDVLLCIAARFARINWKYEGIAYSVILKNVGVLLQTMYIVATAMGLAPCAIGAGDSTDFAEATGCAAFVEESVGELALGRRRRESGAFASID